MQVAGGRVPLRLPHGLLMGMLVHALQQLLLPVVCLSGSAVQLPFHLPMLTFLRFVSRL